MCIGFAGTASFSELQFRCRWVGNWVGLAGRLAALDEQNCVMAGDLKSVVAALADLSDGEFHALIDATHEVPQIAPGLRAWLEHACDWEQHRRRGFDFPLQPPGAGIPPEEDAVSIDAAMAMRATFAQEDQTEACAMVRLCDAIIGVLSGGGHRH